MKHSTITMTPDQAALYDRDPWSSWRTEEDFLELADRQNLREPLVVTWPDGRVAFAVSGQGVCRG